MTEQFQKWLDDCIEVANTNSKYAVATEDNTEKENRKYWHGKEVAFTQIKEALQKVKCGQCYDCLQGVNHPGTSIPIIGTRMILCPDCGNKRCPKATNHRNACTDSNEPGQPGSNYPSRRDALESAKSDTEPLTPISR